MRAVALCALQDENRSDRPLSRASHDTDPVATSVAPPSAQPSCDSAAPLTAHGRAQGVGSTAEENPQAVGSLLLAPRRQGAEDNSAEEERMQQRAVGHRRIRRKSAGTSVGGKLTDHGAALSGAAPVPTADSTGVTVYDI
jgi:hypothetical protein